MSDDYYDLRDDRSRIWDHYEQERLIRKFGEPRYDPFKHLIDPDPETLLALSFGFIADNKDPLGLGRVMLFIPELDLGDPMTPLGWFPLIRPFTGFWIMPDIGEKVLIIFLDNNPSCPVALSSMYTLQTPPDPAVKKDRHQLRLSTKGGSVLAFHEEKGKEAFELSTAKGKMRLVIDDEHGLEITNELGDIHFECEKFEAGGGEMLIECEKDLEISAGEINLESSKGIKIESAKEVVLKGSKIKLQGSSVTAGGKPVASENDQAIGIDMHTIMVPSSSGLQPMPNVPHPFLGKLTSKLSKTVTFGERAVATKGSEAVMPGPGHVPMPPGVQFQQTPKGKGKITGGCIDKVKVDGKPIAVIGSTVTSCSDTGQSDHINVIAAGAPAVLPIMMPGMDPDQYKRDGGTQFDTRDLYSKNPPNDKYRNPKMKNPKWSVNKSKVGEEVTLSVEFEGQYPGCSAYFDVYRDGDDPEKVPPIKKLFGHNREGKAEVVFKPFDFREDDDDKSTLDLMFDVQAFKCGHLKSSKLEVTPPQVTEVEWGKSKGFVSDSYSWKAKAKGFPDGEKGVWQIKPKDNPDLVLLEVPVTVKEEKLEGNWTGSQEDLERLENAFGDEKVKDNTYLLDVRLGRYKADKPGEIKLVMKLHRILDVDDIILKNHQAKLTFRDGSKFDLTSDSDGYLNKDEVPFLGFERVVKE